MLKVFRKAFFLSLLFFNSCTALAQKADSFKVIQLKIGDKILSKVALADDTVKRTQGLMNMESWKGLDGVLFVFEDAGKRSFWMKNTFLKLSIGFFNKKRELKEVFELNPPKSLAQTKVDRVVSGKYAAYALEVPQGWFKKNKISINSKIWILD